MKKFMLLTISFVLIFSNFVMANEQNKNAQIELKHQKYVLDNGLTLLVHQDTKAPIVAVNIWYHVGSKDEQAGKTGFAHLFEHLMFNGSENYNDDWFKPFDRVGATGMNGTTNQDRTNYYEVVPKNALEMTLWLESDRMGHLLGAIDQAKLDEQRDVVKNEKRQGENQPYGKVFSTLLKNVYPAGHPYSWSVIGSMDDLNAATVEDVHNWFKSKYGAANATISIAGDIEPEKAKALVEKYFSAIPSGPPLLRQEKWIAKRQGKHVQEMYDNVPHARVYKVWNVPEWGSKEANHLSLASSVLSSGKKSRLYNRLVYKEQVAVDVSAFSFQSEIGGLFGIVATAHDPEKLDYIEQAIDEELNKFLAKGPTKEELARVKVAYRAGLIRGLESVGAKASVLVENQVYSNDPTFYLNELNEIEQATTKQVQQTSADWLSDGEYLLRVLPFAKYTTTKPSIDRSKGWPEVGAAPEVEFDKLQRFSLSNGIKVLFAHRDTVPTVLMRMIFDAGHAGDLGGKLGTASLSMQMLTEGTDSMDGLKLNTRLAQLGTSLNSYAGLDSSIVQLNTLTENLDESLDLFADVIINPNFPKEQLKRLKAQTLASIAQSKSSPFGIAYRILPTLLFGENHAYSHAFSGSGDETSVPQINVDDLRQYHKTWLTADNATLVVTGDSNVAELKSKLEKAFAKMQTGKAPEKQIAAVATEQKNVIYLVDRPDSQQSAIIAAKLLPEWGFENELPLQLANEVLGASFNARINMNLREDKGWSYGARSSIHNTQSQRPFITQAPVQTDKTAESMQEIFKEINAISSSKPASADEFARALDKRTLTLPSRWETTASVQSDITSLVKYGLTEEYWDNYVKNLRQLDIKQVNKAAKQYLSPQNIIWLVIGDLSKIEDKIRATKLGKVIILDKDGKPVNDEQVQ